MKQIGGKIKQARMRMKKTQQQIADECMISKSLLSKIENGQTGSAVATLSKICQSLDISLTWVLDERPETDLVLLKKENRQFSIEDEGMGYSFELLANRSTLSTIEPTIVHVTPKDSNKRYKPYTHQEDEFIYILEGSIHLLYDDEKYLLKKGDTAYFRGVNQHLFIPVDNQGAMVLTVFIEGS